MTAAAEPRERVRRTQRLTAGEIAWLLVAPVALLALAAIAWLAPPLGEALLTPDDADVWPSWEIGFTPEPVEQARFMTALAVVPLLAGAIVVVARRGPRLPKRGASWAIGATELTLVAFVVLCVMVQRQLVFGETYSLDPAISFRRSYFTIPTLLAAAVGTVALVLALRSAAVRARWADWALDTRARRLVCGALAAAAVALWLAHAFNTEDTIGGADGEVRYHVQFPLAEVFAVLDGRSPLVDFTSQYGFLLPYAFAAGMSGFGETVGVYVALALLLTAAALLAIFAVLRRVAHSPLGALLLFLPFLATAFFLGHGELDNRYTFATLFGSHPTRFAGPLVLCWLTVRHLDGARPHTRWLLFAFGGIVLLNNVDTGLPALGASFAALMWARRPRSRRDLAALIGALVAGLLLALTLVSTLLLARTGSLPELGRLTYFSRMFGAAGFGQMPMPALGLHLVVYVTFVAAIAVATTQAVSGAPQRALTGALAWSGVFGLGAGTYYAGRSHPESLIATFSTWSFSLALLLVVVIGAIARRPDHRPRIAELLCIFGFAVAACSLAQTPTPWGQAARLQEGGEPVLAAPSGQAFVAARTQPGEPVAILLHLGHRIGANLGLPNVSPYASTHSMPFVSQLDETLKELRGAGGRKVFFHPGDLPLELPTYLTQAGYRERAVDAVTGVALWSR